MQAVIFRGCQMGVIVAGVPFTKRETRGEN